MTDIETERLILRVVPMAALASTAAGMVDITRNLIGEKLPDQWFDDGWVYKTRYDQWIEDATFAPWSVRCIALKDDGQVVGNMNCHHKPMPFSLHGKTRLGVEMGYTIFTPWQKQGIAYEAVNGFSQWASSQGLESIILSIQPSNGASLALARKLGAMQIGSQVDDLHGPEDIYHFSC